MATYHTSNSAVLGNLLAPALDAYQGSSNTYDCAKLTDLDFIEMGVARCVGDAQSGRGFLQAHSDNGRADISVDLFFKSLQSQRRLDNLISVNSRLAPLMSELCSDPYADHSELSGFDLIAGDGHYHSAACHDKKNKSGKKLPTGHLFMVNMRTHYMRQLTMAERRNGGRGNEHDMHALKRTEMDDLRGGAPKGRKVIIVWDRAGIDFGYWQKCKMQSGIYFISREKENMALQVIGNNVIDKKDDRNAGVIKDELVGPASVGHMLRRVIYKTPEGTVYSYLTTEMKIPPGLIVLLYKQRWDIEKIFDEYKNKLMERKSWASSKEAKAMNAAFLCLAHNLMLMLETKLEKENEIKNEAEEYRKEKGRTENEERLVKKGTKPDFVSTALRRMTVRSIKFVRWLRNFIYRESPWNAAIARLRKIYATL